MVVSWEGWRPGQGAERHLEDSGCVSVVGNGPVFVPLEMLVAQLCLTLCNSMGCIPSGSSVCDISQARILDRVAIPSSRGSSRPRDETQVSCIVEDSLPSEPPGKPLWCSLPGAGGWGARGLQNAARPSIKSPLGAPLLTRGTL